jgi:hypothetical protein
MSMGSARQCSPVRIRFFIDHADANPLGAQRIPTDRGGNCTPTSTSCRCAIATKN